MALTRGQKDKLQGILREGININSDLYVSLALAKIVRDQDTANVHFVKEVLNYKRATERRLSTRIMKIGLRSSYIYYCYSLAECALTYLTEGEDSLLRSYSEVPKREKFKRGQIILCLSSTRSHRYLEFYRGAASEKQSEFELNNALYAIANTGRKEEYPFIAEFLTIPRMYPFAAVHIVYHWADTPDKARLLLKPCESAPNSVRKSMLQNMLRRFELIEGEFEEDEVFSAPLPPGWPTPDPWSYYLP